MSATGNQTMLSLNDVEPSAAIDETPISVCRSSVDRIAASMASLSSPVPAG